MQHVLRLAQAWRLSRDVRYSQAVVLQICDGIRSNPWMHGINWTSPMEGALRLISWAWATRWIFESGSNTEEFGLLVAASVHQHLEFVDRNYSLYSSANNHLIAEASGAYIAASYWRGLKCAARVRARAREHLLRECLRQNFPDGVNHEQTFSYQVFVWDLLVLAALTGRRTGDEFPSSYWHRLESMAEFIAHVTDRNGHIPNIGDQDDGTVIDLGSSAAEAQVELLSLASILFDENESLNWKAYRTSERTAWLTGVLRTGERSDDRQSRSFPYGGYYSLKSNPTAVPEVMLLVDVGPNGDRITGVHGHADALSVYLHVDGKPVIADPGTYSYQDVPLRRFLRATGQHNTLCFGDASQSEYVNRFLWGRRAKVTPLQCNLTDDVKSASGRVQWWDGGEHTRSVSVDFSGRHAQIEDTWSGRDDARLNFVIHPAIRVSKIGLRECRLFIDSVFVDLQWDCGVVSIDSMPFSESCYKLADATRISVNVQGSSGCIRSAISWGVL